MKAINTLSLAALALTATTFLACSNDNLTIENNPTKQDNVVTLVATLSSENGTETRSVMTDNGTTISTAWEVGDKIWVNYDDTGDNNCVAKGTVSAVTDGKATVTVDLVNPKDASIIVFGFPYDHWTEAKDVHIDQIGTLADINQNHASITGSGTLTVMGSIATLPDNVSMNKEMAIWKLNFKDGGTDITNQITSLNINCGVDGDYMVTPNAKSNIYVALYPVDGKNITITAATATGNYSYSKSGVTLDNGKFYRSEVAMSAAVPSGTYRVFTDRTTYSDETIPVGATTVTSGTTTWAAGTYVVSGNVAITEDVHLTGDVNLILCDGAELTVNGCIFGGTDYEHGFVYKLNIFGQALGTGKLTVDYSGNHSLGVVTASELNIHGGIITVGGTGVWQGLEPNVFNVYHGKIDASGIVSGIALMGNAHIYGGNITSVGNYQAAINLPNGGKTLTISGGTVTAVNNGSSTGIETVYGLEITGGTVLALGGNNSEGIISYGNIAISGGKITTIAGKNGIALEGSTITISGGDVLAIGGSALADTNGNGMAGIDGSLTVTGGIVTAIGGEKDGTGTDGLGISSSSTIALTGVTMYEGDAADPATPADEGGCPYS